MTKTGFKRADGDAATGIATEMTANQAYKAYLASAKLQGAPPTFKEWLAGEQKEGRWLKAEPEKQPASAPAAEQTAPSAPQPWRPLGMHPLGLAVVIIVIGGVIYYVCKPKCGSAAV